jgi:hypothetical protein
MPQQGQSNKMPRSTGQEQRCLNKGKSKNASTGARAIKWAAIKGKGKKCPLNKGKTEIPTGFDRVSCRAVHS